jgi:hypothetical protein
LAPALVADTEPGRYANNMTAANTAPASTITSAMFTMRLNTVVA